MEWKSGEVTIVLPEGGEVEVRGFIHGEVAIVAHDADWLALHRRSGLILGRFTSQGVALELGHRLNCSVSRSLKRAPEAWSEGFWERLEEIRAEVARENVLPPPSRLRATDTPPAAFPHHQH